MSEKLNSGPLLASTLLEAKNLSHNFDYELFKNINLKLEKKEKIAIIGTSGSGKSTLLNILSSLLKPTSGNVVFQNEDLYSLKQNELLKIRRDDFGIIFQAHYLFRGFSAMENLNIATLLSHTDIDLQLLKDLAITHVLNQGVGELSGGQQQRLSIARILMKKPKIIFADEPTGNLDEQNEKNIISIFMKIKQEKNCTIIMVTHNMKVAKQADVMLTIDNYKIKEEKK